MTDMPIKKHSFARVLQRAACAGGCAHGRSTTASAPPMRGHVVAEGPTGQHRRALFDKVGRQVGCITVPVGRRRSRSDDGS
jgi:hypothetical protein